MCGRDGSGVGLLSSCSMSEIPGDFSVPPEFQASITNPISFLVLHYGITLNGSVYSVLKPGAKYYLNFRADQAGSHPQFDMKVMA